MKIILLNEYRSVTGSSKVVGAFSDIDELLKYIVRRYNAKTSDIKVQGDNIKFYNLGLTLSTTVTTLNKGE